MPRDPARCQGSCRRGLLPGCATLPLPTLSQVSSFFFCSSLQVALSSSSLTGKEVPSPLPLSSYLQKKIKLEEIRGLYISKPLNHNLQVKRPQRIAHHATTMEEVSFYSTVEGRVVVPTYAVSCKNPAWVKEHSFALLLSAWMMGI